MRTLIFLALAALPVAALDAAESTDADRLAEAYVDIRLARDPFSGLMAGLVDPAKIRLPDRSEQAMAGFDAREDQVAAQMAKSADATKTSGILREMIGADQGLRICRRELWNVSHMTGWQVGLPQFAAMQPVATPEQRAAALAFWADLPRFVDVEIANLRRGIAAGYTVPRPVALRVIQQLDGALANPGALMAPAGRANDPAFAAEYQAQFESKVKPALARYRDFLRDEYAPKARTSLGLSALPNGAACYEAQLRAFTTLDRDGKSVFELGGKAVLANRQAVAAIGKERFGATDFAATVRKVADAPDNRFASEEELLTFLRAAAARGQDKAMPYFASPLSQPVIVEPLPDFQRGTGIPSHYQPSPDPARPGIYRAQTDTWARTSRGDAEVTAMHEAVPGHHLQTVIGRQAGAPSRLARLAANPALFEGWGRYAEGLAEEAGAYATPYAAIARRVWPGRGMIADPGLHLFGWTREQAVALIVESGRFSAEEADAMVDRMAAMPAQMTAYDSGALEIAALRKEAEEKLGTRFDLKQFHDQLLGVGSVPLTMLRTHIQGWIGAQQKTP